MGSYHLKLRRRNKILADLRAISDPEGRIARRIAWTRPLTALEKDIVPELDTLSLCETKPALGGRHGLCHHNCKEAAASDPSFRIVLGWLRMFEGGPIPRCYCSHSVLERGGELFDPTPRPGGVNPDPFVPDVHLSAAWEQVANGDMRVSFTRRGVNIPYDALRTADGILSLEWVWAFTLNPAMAPRTPQYRDDC